MFYKTIQNRVKKLINFSKTYFILIKKLYITILVYTNFEFLKNRQEKKIKKT